MEHKPRLKKIDAYETPTHKIVILVDTATNGREYAEAHVKPKKEKNNDENRI
jgi:hypothetical protein